MTEEEFQVFRRGSIAELAQVRAAESDRTVSEALPDAEAEFDKLAPQGIQTPDKFLYHLRNDVDQPIGYLWFRIRTLGNKKTIFILDIKVYEEWRGRGLAKFMLDWLENEARQMGIPEISLHVLGSNQAGRGLYETLGYEVTNLYLAKKLKN